MNYLEYAKRLTWLEHQVEKSATGTPCQLADRLGISERTARRMIYQLKREGLSIRYCRIRQSYVRI